MGDGLVGWVTPEGLRGRRPCCWGTGQAAGRGSPRCHWWAAGGCTECSGGGRPSWGTEHSSKRFHVSMLGGEGRNGGQAGTLRLRDDPRPPPPLRVHGRQVLGPGPEHPPSPIPGQSALSFPKETTDRPPAVSLPRQRM